MKSKEKKVKKTEKAEGKQSKPQQGKAGKGQQIKKKVKDTVEGVVKTTRGVADTTQGIKDLDVRSVIKGVKDTVDGIKDIKNALNHDEWYLNYADEVNSMIGPNFNRPIGLLESGIAGPNNIAIPGACGISVTLMPALPDARANGSWLGRIYAGIRRANSGSVNYTPRELFLYLTKYRNVVALISIGKWAYGTANQYTNLNLNQPADLFTAKGLDIVSFTDNLANLRSKLNNVITTVNTYASIDLDIYKRTEWMFTNTFEDSKDGKSQKYVFSLQYYPRVNVPSDASGQASLDISFERFSGTPLGSSATGMTYTQYIKILNDVINDFLSFNKTPVISGDIIKAYSNKLSVKQFSYIEELYQTPTVYDDSVLTQIQNAYVGSSSTPVPALAFEAGATDFHLSLYWSNPNNNTRQTFVDDVDQSHFINFYKDEIKPVDVIKATRFQTFYVLQNNGTQYKQLAWGTEIVNDLAIVYSYAPSSNYKKLNALYLTNGWEARYDAGDYNIRDYLWSCFDYMPAITYSIRVPAANDGSKFKMSNLFDFNNYARIDTADQLQDIHNIATLSLWYVPLLVKSEKNLIDLGK